MLSLDNILTILDYKSSANYFTDLPQFDINNRHYFDLLQRACDNPNCNFKGIMMFDVAAGKEKSFSKKPLLVVASANSPNAARELHKLVWNIGSIPFVLIKLPSQLRLYNGFSFSKREKSDILEELDSSVQEKAIRSKLSDITLTSLETGKIWHSDLVKEIDIKKRVDHRLLKNLKTLGKDLLKSLDSNTAHSLIGKYIYIRYLRDRNILSDKWLLKENIDLDKALSDNANLSGFRQLVFALEKRFNGKIFELDLSDCTKVTDNHVNLVASIISGNEIKENGVVQQTFSFMDYDFQYIPVETLSIVYQQFLHAKGTGKAKGAFYTPENLAEYLLNQMDTVAPIELNMKIFDPSCGSGIFLVLAYRRIIEIYRKKSNKKFLNPAELRSLLLDSIYGVEFDLDACNVASFSLILTLLNYVDPPDLHRNPNFKFPSLVNDGKTGLQDDNRIFKADFFDPNSSFSQLDELKFDRIMGNPPWVNLKKDNLKDQTDLLDTPDHNLALKWIDEAKKQNIVVADNRLQDAFACKVLDHLSDKGMIGLVMPSTSLFFLKGNKFRQQLFHRTQFEQVCNFANVRDILFETVIQPTSTWIYRLASSDVPKKQVVHYAPMCINQNAIFKSVLLYITMYESEIQYINHYDIEDGEGVTWKLAMWGNHRLKRVYKQIKHIFPNTLSEYCRAKGWGNSLPVQGPEFRNIKDIPKKQKDNYEFYSDYSNIDFFDEKSLNSKNLDFQCFTIPSGVLKTKNENFYWLRKRGGKAGFKVTHAPHLLIAAQWGKHFIYSDKDFIIPPRQSGISCPDKDKDYLKAITVFLYSNLAKFCIFLTSPKLGIYPTFNVIETTRVKELPVPDFAVSQVKILAKALDALIKEEKNAKGESRLWKQKRQKKVNDLIYKTLDIPEGIQLLIEDFFENKYPLNESKNLQKKLIEEPGKSAFENYAITLRNELDDFLDSKAFHEVSVFWHNELVHVKIKVLSEGNVPLKPSIREVNEEEIIKQYQQISVQQTSMVSKNLCLCRSVRVFEDDEIQLFKPCRKIDFSYSSALADSDDIIAEIIGE